jgi:hypothetical protein
MEELTNILNDSNVQYKQTRDMVANENNLKSLSIYVS